MVVGVALAVLFAPLGAVLIAAAKTGRGRVLAWAVAGSLAAGLVWMLGALALRQAGWLELALWSLVGTPWASALGAVAGWRHGRARMEKAGK
jgi:hypothetical protein